MCRPGRGASADRFQPRVSPPGRSRRSARPVAGGLSTRLPDPVALPRAVRAAHLDLPDRRQPGAQQAALVAPAPARGSHLARRPSHTLRRDRGNQRSAPRSAAGEQGNRRAHLGGDGASALRSAHGAGASRGRRPALRGDRVQSQRGRRHGEIAAHARTAGAARGAAGDSIMIPYLDCRAAQEMLEPFVDGELAVNDQVALESHLRWCRVCAVRVEDMQLIGASLRVTSCALRAADEADDSLTSVRSEVLTRIQTEREQSMWTQLHGMCDDMRFFWPAIGASFALAACLFVAVTVVSLTSDENPDSLAGMIQLLANPGSDANPMRLDGAMAAPPRSLGRAGLESVPGDDDEAVFALAAVVRGGLPLPRRGRSVIAWAGQAPRPGAGSGCRRARSRCY